MNRNWREKCPINEGAEVSMTRQGVIDACLGLQERDKKWKDQNKRCVDCKRGILVKQGKKFDPPRGITINDLENLIQQRSAQMEKQGFAGNDRINPIPATELKKLTVAKIRDYWRAGRGIPPGQRGTCPNCTRGDMSSAAAGLCGTCYTATKGLTGTQVVIPALDASYTRINGPKFGKHPLAKKTTVKEPQEQKTDQADQDKTDSAANQADLAPPRPEIDLTDTIKEEQIPVTYTIEIQAMMPISKLADHEISNVGNTIVSSGINSVSTPSVVRLQAIRASFAKHINCMES